MGNLGAQERLLVPLLTLEVYPYLAVLTDDFDDPKCLGAVLEFSSRPLIRQTLIDWSQESVHAKMLLEVADLTVKHSSELRQIYTFQSTELVKKRFTNIEEQYLCSLLATRLWSPNLAPLTVDEVLVDGAKLVAWIEKLKLFVLLQSMVAAEQRHPKERGLADVARYIRICTEDIDKERAAILHRISSGATSYSVFVSNSQYRVRALSDTGRATNSPKNHKFLQTLERVLSQDWIPFYPERRATEGEKDAPGPHSIKLEELREKRIGDHQGLSLSLPAHQTGETSPSIRKQDDIVVEDDGTGGPGKPFVPGTKAIFQNLEMSLMLPFSWHRVLDHERTALKSRLMLAHQGDPQTRLGSCITSLSILLSRNIHAATLLRIGTELLTDWTLNIKNGALVRLPPRIAEGWVPPSGGAVDDWIQPLAHSWSIKLDDSLVSSLQNAFRRHSKCATLGELWACVSPRTPVDQWLREFIEGDSNLDRLSTAMVSEYLPMMLHGTTGDQATIALIASNPRTVLSARCTYISHTADHLTKIWNTTAIGADLTINSNSNNANDFELNAGGSNLLADLSRIRQKIHAIGASLEIDPTNAEESLVRHNRYIGILVLALLACTGARPVNSPFQSLSDFDFVNKFVFVSDKQGGRGHNDRICVLGTRIANWLLTDYQPYLLRLASWIEGINDISREIAAEIRRSVSGQHQCIDPSIPFFFFLERSNEGILWSEVTEESLRAALAEDWLLPMNAFRHIFSTYLTKSGISSDIRDALMGHAERYAEPHGDFSLRVPATDLENAHATIDELFNLIFPDDWRPTPPTLSQDLGGIGFVPTQLREYGRHAREMRRLEARDKSRAQAQEEIASLTADANLKLWTSDQWYQLGSKMLTRSDGIPHSAGWLRYQVFEAFVRSAWEKHGALNRSHKALMRLPEAKAYFKESVSNVERRLELVVESFQGVKDSIKQPNSTPVLSGCIAAISLILDFHLASFDLVRRTIFDPRSIKSVWYKNSYWIEWTVNRDEKWSAARPVFRLRASQEVLKFLNAAKHSGSAPKKWPKAPAILDSWIAKTDKQFNVGSSLETFLRKLVQWTEQRNNLRMPGVFSAYLAQRQLSCALPHDFWVRFEGEPPLTQPNQDQAALEEASATTVAALRVALSAEEHSFANDALPGALYDNAVSFFRSIKEAIQARDTDRTGKYTKIIEIINDSRLPKGNAARELGNYSLHLASRKKLRGRGELSLSTIERNWYHLEKGFLEYASNINMLGMDDEEVTQLYAGVVAASGNRSLEEDDPANVDARSRACREIQHFHEFAASSLSIPEPDWSEFCEPAAWVNIRPGTVGLHDIQRALTLLIGGAAAADLSHSALSAALVFVLCSRFGLRVGEAVGLQRRDLYYQGNVLLLYVRPNSIRSIKTGNSKRTVPLIEKLFDNELGVLKEVLNRWERRADRNTHLALFEGVNGGTFKATRSRISGLISDALRLATGVPSTTTHHLRHAFAMRMIGSIANLPQTFSGAPSLQNSQHIQRLLLGHSIIDKRNLWAVARLLGHASPGVTVLSYTHTLANWINRPADPSKADSGPTLYVDFDLDRLSRASEFKIAEGQPASSPKKKFRTRMLQFLTFARNLGSGLDKEQAKERAGLKHAECVEFDDHFNKLFIRILPNAKLDDQTTKELFNDVPLSGWKRLFAICSKEISKGDFELPEWHLMANARMELILYDASQISSVLTFMKSLGLKSTNLRLVYHPESGVDFIDSIKSTTITANSASEENPKRRIDRHVLPNGTIQKNRAVLQDGDLTVTRLELCILWMIFWMA